uniref:Corrinoid adenosyltransferase n=1 Tax=Rhabditophanes sp. KR3021 TaxID=114890 RepID=A0AC35TWQ8_9BILA
MSDTPVNINKFKQNRGTGDSGKTSLYTNERRYKNDPTFEAIGAVDSLSSYLGIARELAELDDKLSDLVDIISKSQCCLQDLASHIATPQGTGTQKKQNLTQFEEWYPQFIDANIDKYAEGLPPLKLFILPAGGVVGAHLQYARTLARQTERLMVPLHLEGSINEHSLKFINRMSDLLFVLGRYAAMRTGSIEKTYIKPRKDADDKLKWMVTDFKNMSN